MKFRISLLLLFIFISSVVQSQIKGKIVDSKNLPIPFVNIFVKGTTKGTTTNEKGVFLLNYTKKEGSIEVSFVGYKTQSFKISSITKPLHIVLKSDDDVLDEVVIVTKPKKRLKKKENPAYRILKEIWKRKRKIGVEQADTYQFKKHTVTEVGLNNLDTTFIKRLFKEQYKQVMKEVNYDSDGVNYYIPVFIEEQISKVYGNNKIEKKREDIEAEKKEGFGGDGFVFDKMANTFQNFNVFKNNIVLFRKSFTSPISKNGFAVYDYVLYDSIVKNNKKSYNIYFFPRRKNDLAFQGNFWVADKSFAIQKIKMKATKNTDVNFVRGLTFEKEFKQQNDSIYLPVKNYYEGDFTLVDKKNESRGLTVKKTETFSNYLLNQEKSVEFYDFVQSKTRPQQYTKDSTYWKENTEKNVGKYKLIKSVKEKRQIKKLTGIINVLATGYVNIHKTNFQLGYLWNSVGNNEVEGFRGKVGFRTFKTKDDRFRLLGYLAYGFKDKKIKYGTSARYLLSYEPRIEFGAAYQKDIKQLAAQLFNSRRLLDPSYGGSAIFSRGSNFFLSNIEKATTKIDYAINPNLHFGINFTKSRITSATSLNKFSIDYLDSDGKIQSGITDFTSDIYISFTPGRNIYGLGVVQQYGEGLYPALMLNYSKGYKDIFGGTQDYSKIQFRYKQPIVLGTIGVLNSTIELGQTFGKVPLPLLNPVPANQSYFLSDNTFSLINYYDFVTDKYASTHFTHHFNGFLFNRIPLIEKLKLRALATFKTAYGTISDKNKLINRSNIIYNAPNEKLYYEYGCGIENIGFGNFRPFRIDAIWRSDYTPSPSNVNNPSPKFAFRIGFSQKL